MRILFIFLFMVLTGCGSAQLVSSRFKPKKMGTVKLDIPGPGSKGMVQEQAEKIMTEFCAPEKYQLVGTDRQDQVEGAYANKWGTSYQYQSMLYIHFECGG